MPIGLLGAMIFPALKFPTGPAVDSFVGFSPVLDVGLGGLVFGSCSSMGGLILLDRCWGSDVCGFDCRLGFVVTGF